MYQLFEFLDGRKIGTYDGGFCWFIPEDYHGRDYWQHGNDISGDDLLKLMRFASDLKGLPDIFVKDEDWEKSKYAHSY